MIVTISAVAEAGVDKSYEIMARRLSKATGIEVEPAALAVDFEDANVKVTNAELRAVGKATVALFKPYPKLYEELQHIARVAVAVSYVLGLDPGTKKSTGGYDFTKVNALAALRAKYGKG